MERRPGKERRPRQEGARPRNEPRRDSADGGDERPNRRPPTGDPEANRRGRAEADSAPGERPAPRRTAPRPDASNDEGRGGETARPKRAPGRKAQNAAPARKADSAHRRQKRKEEPTRTEVPALPAGGMRINRYIAHCGVCARRDAEVLVREGRVRLNGEVVTDLATRVQEGDRVEVSGKVISPQGFIYLLLNKPDDTITTTSDERGRTTVLDLIDLDDEEKRGLFPVGRLDRHTVGVLLLTNDGELANRMMHPRYMLDKIYQVRTEEPVKPHELDDLMRGVELEDGLARAERASYIDPQDRHEIAMLLHEGRNRQVRRMMEALGHSVTRLERISYAGITVQGVRRGKWRRLRASEVRRLRNLVNLK